MKQENLNTNTVPVEKKIVEKGIIHMLVGLARQTPIPEDAEATPLYKVLVRKLRQRLLSANDKFDFIDVELTSRRMARWMENISKEAAKRSLTNIEATKVIGEDVQLEEDQDRENIVVEQLHEISDIASLRSLTVGEPVRLFDERGRRVVVETLSSGDTEKKALVTKELSPGELNTWIVRFKNPSKSTSLNIVDEMREKTPPKLTKEDQKKKIKNDIRGKLDEIDPKRVTLVEARGILMSAIESSKQKPIKERLEISEKESKGLIRSYFSEMRTNKTLTLSEKKTLYRPYTKVIGKPPANERAGTR